MNRHPRHTRLGALVTITRSVLGTAPVSPPVTVNSTAVERTPPNTGLIFSAPLTGNNANPNSPVWLTAAVTDGTTTQTRHTWLPAAITAPGYDDDGNLTNDGQWSYLWDAEHTRRHVGWADCAEHSPARGDFAMWGQNHQNRLVEMETTQAAVQVGRPYRRLTFAYDWTGKRLARTVYGPNASVLSTTRWLYDGWNPVAEFSDQTTGQTLVRAYLWGMDLSGTMQGAGGVGGLLSVTQFDIPNSSFVIFHPSYDGNGNIVAWTSSGTTAPTSLREYDSFGNIVVEHGAPPCAIGFSTKLEDPATGLLYYGYRYLSPPLGRWLSNDPLEENHDTGEFNALVFILNDPIGGTDLLGMARQEGGRNSVPPANRGPGPYQPTRIDQVPAPIKRPIPMLPTGEGPNITRDSGGTGRLPTNIQGPPIVKGPVITPRTGTPWIDDPWKPWEPLAPIQPRGSPLGPRTPGAGIGGLGIVLEIVHFTEDMARLRRLVGHIEFIAGWVAAGKSAAYAKIGRPCSGCLVLDIAEYMSIPGNAKLKPAGHPTGVAAFEILFYERPCKDVNYKGEPWAFYDPHAIRRRTVKEDVILP